MKLLQTSLELPVKGFGNLNMDSTNNEHSLPLQAGNSLNVSLDDSEFPLDLGDMTSFERPTMLTFESPTPDSSPSPNLLYPHNMQSMVFDVCSNSMESYPNYPAEPNIPIVEFTDLTNPYFEDRRRRKSNPVRDKQTISSMHMRRRAQNRASQRAFRERKEKHAQDLQQQLNELEAKHRDLLDSYEKLDATNTKMAEEMECLRERIAALQTSDSGDLNELSINSFFEGVDFDQAVQDAEPPKTPQL